MIVSSYKTELLRRRGPRPNVEAIEFATIDWVVWLNNQRLLELIGDTPSAEKETLYCERFHESALAA